MEFIRNQLLAYDLDPILVKYLSIIIMIIFIALICIIANFITKKIVMRVIAHIVNNNKLQWDNVLMDRKVFHKLSHIVPALIIYFFASTFPAFQNLIEKAAITYIIIVGLMVMNSLLDAINDIYQTYEVSKARPIKGYIQVAKIIVIILGFLLVVANLIGESPLMLLSGIGALSAVLMLVFRDSILGLVAGVQLTANDMVRVGDWIEMPKYEADGDVIDISLNTVKVQNWDNTVTTIPSYAMISDSFKNWRAMQTSGGRRMKRSLLIDKNSISFCTEDMIEKFKDIHYLSDYITSREQEIEEYNSKYEINRSNPVNGRALTNIGVFRAYISSYLKSHPGINQDMIWMVRPLAPNEHGVPMEIYAFTHEVGWVEHEAVQADIFDHLFAIAPEFGLRLFQNPSGHDLRKIADDSGRDNS
ncbi:mechanosensitive ion channel family protein [Salinibacillus xinjiangensis]|uniref:Mechanosensing system component YbdG n=1 Tax=Salinibacillus xinjiangensis TaxID=1229268 RepID=A0A6G1X736_9BACI|nr:mechanosensitive ion channel family protein [Salinibacillus xinjiangensis]MRG86757.1 mechanosensitive ion channel [Salinibacillus xinjiangensis]